MSSRERGILFKLLMLLVLLVLLALAYLLCHPNPARRGALPRKLGPACGGQRPAAGFFPSSVESRGVAAPDSDFDPGHWWNSRWGQKLFFHQAVGMCLAWWELRHPEADSGPTGAAGSVPEGPRGVALSRGHAEYYGPPIPVYLASGL